VILRGDCILKVPLFPFGIECAINFSSVEYLPPRAEQEGQHSTVPVAMDYATNSLGHDAEHKWLNGPKSVLVRVLLCIQFIDIYISIGVYRKITRGMTSCLIATGSYFCEFLLFI
jgi:hypothetical protein